MASNSSHSKAAINCSKTPSSLPPHDPGSSASCDIAQFEDHCQEAFCPTEPNPTEAPLLDELRRLNDPVPALKSEESELQANVTPLSNEGVNSVIGQRKMECLCGCPEDQCYCLPSEASFWNKAHQTSESGFNHHDAVMLPPTHNPSPRQKEHKESLRQNCSRIVEV